MTSSAKSKATSLQNDTAWYVVRTRAREEAKAVHYLRRQDMDVFLPCYRRVVRHSRQSRIVARPLFPSYLFVNVSSVPRWRSINGTPGVAAILTAGDHPSQLAGSVVQDIRNLRGEDGCISLIARQQWVEGDVVRLTQPGFREKLGLFVEIQDNERVQGLLNLLGRSVRASVDVGWVEKVA